LQNAIFWVAGCPFGLPLLIMGAVGSRREVYPSTKLVANNLALG
jgi:hypothetical protein